MIRNVDPEVMITTNYAKDYFKDVNGNELLVDTDGVDGTTMEDEETVLKYVDQQFSVKAIPPECVRPLGAYLTGEQ